MKGDIQRIFQEYGNAYIEHNRDRLTLQHLKVVRCIQNCGTPAAGWIQFECPDCQAEQYLERSCGNRMCPSCQTAKAHEWLNKRLEQQLPTHYFLITFTMPKELNPFFLYKPQEAFSAFFRASAGALKRLAANPKYLGVDLPGFFAVLHTWGRTLNFHPHIHFVVPGGGIDKGKELWRSTAESFYAPGQALAKVCKGIFSEIIKEAGLHEHVNPSVWLRKWVVDCEAVGQNREGVIKYLAPYVFKTAITDSRIVGVVNGKVTFTYRKSGSRRVRRMTLDVNEFIPHRLHARPTLRIHGVRLLNSASGTRDSGQACPRLRSRSNRICPYTQTTVLLSRLRSTAGRSPDYRPQHQARRHR
ncbi:MAG: transposase [Deltaproteobacteria bacterium]|nr:transposase [Deltaproteobacteria bacterium]